ncbi:MAG: hypothetical protein PUP46_07795 [Endozoicomonas sp. (ex Botrylloides leachii)]|nr:hypothetical protein [Endozoicomonas sp. (ex Botrylloides leachii)]
MSQIIKKCLLGYKVLLLNLILISPTVFAASMTNLPIAERNILDTEHEIKLGEYINLWSEY